MSLIAVRRNIQANAIFYKQIADSVFYSLDKVTWYFAFSLPSATSESATNNYNTFIRKYYQDTDVTNIFNPPGDPPPQTRPEVIDVIRDIESRRVSNRAICAGAEQLVRTLNEAGRLSRSEEITALQPTVDNASSIVSAVMALGALFTPVGWAVALVGGAVAVKLGTEIGYDVILNNIPALTEGDVESAICIIYEACKGGEFSYADVNALDPIPGANWQEIYTPELHSAFISMIKEAVNGSDPCPCETCYEYYPIEQEIARGQVLENSLLSVDTIVSGSLREMHAIVNVTLPEPLILTKVTVWYLCKSYENVSVSQPMITFSAPGTSGGNTPITDGLKSVEINPAHFPLVGTSTMQLKLNTSLCSACSTAQLATYQNSHGVILYIEVCGNPA